MCSVAYCLVNRSLNHTDINCNLSVIKQDKDIFFVVFSLRFLSVKRLSQLRSSRDSGGALPINRK